jgi:hypothetical protein
MSRNYKFHNPEGDYFVSFAVVEWIDVFTRNEYKDILLESLSFSQKTPRWRGFIIRAGQIYQLKQKYI